MRRDGGARRPSPSRLPPPGARVVTPLLEMVWKAGGFKGKPPPVRVGSRPGALGFQPNANRSVYVDPRVARDLLRLPFDQRQAPRAVDVLLHEYQHVNQPRVSPSWRREAAASARSGTQIPALLNALRMGQRQHLIGPPQSSQMRPYMSQVMALMRMPGYQTYMRRGQYGR